MSGRRQQSDSDLAVVQRRGFLSYAALCQDRAPLYGHLCRTLADEPVVGTIGDATASDFVPLLMAGVKYLHEVDGVEFPQATTIKDFLERHHASLQRFVTCQRVQTNEVQRSWIVVPCLLHVAAFESVSTIHLVEIGSSAGLNLGLDLYGHGYTEGDFGDVASSLCLTGEERAHVPAALLGKSVEIGRRTGIDVAPLDPRRPETLRLLRAFTWPGRQDRVVRLEAALKLIQTVGIDVVRGRWQDVLPNVLREPHRKGKNEAVVVFEIAALGYDGEGVRELLRTIVQAASQGYGTPIYLLQALPSISEGICFELSLECFRLGQRRPSSRVAIADIHGEWIRWAHVAEE